MNERILRNKSGLRIGTAGLVFALAIAPIHVSAEPAAASCDSTEATHLKSEMSSWSLSLPSTIQKAQRLVDVSGECSGASEEPERSSYALSAALANEIKARALRFQGAAFLTPVQTAYVMFKFVENDKLATDADRRDAQTHVAAMSDLLQQSNMQQR